MSTDFTEPADGAWTLEQLVAAEQSGYRLKFLPFWGHTPPSSGAVGPHVFSQWFLHSFASDGVTYPSAEHFMMAEKARLFSDEERLDLILAARTPAEAKKLGRQVRDFDSQVWDTQCVDIVTKVSVAKFGSTEELRSYLVGTGSRVLVEASPQDRIWGIGMARDNPSVERPSEWGGQNLLGFALMRARAQLVTSSG